MDSKPLTPAAVGSADPSVIVRHAGCKREGSNLVRDLSEGLGPQGAAPAKEPPQDGGRPHVEDGAPRLASPRTPDKDAAPSSLALADVLPVATSAAEAPQGAQGKSAKKAVARMLFGPQPSRQQLDDFLSAQEQQRHAGA